MIDTHCHLYAQQFLDDIDAVITKAKAIGVERFVLPAIDSDQVQAMYQLEAKYPKEISLMAGLHPCSVQEDSYQKELDLVKNQLNKRDFVAIGEIGMDLYWDTTTIKIQQHAFAVQIQWAIDLGLPIVIHCRDAFDEIFDVLEQNKHPKLRGIFHCFTGNLQQAERAIAFGMKLGIGGVVTFKNGKIDQFLQQIDIAHLVLETDSPYLAPVPYRGKRNEPAYLDLIANKLAAIYGLPVSEIKEETTNNAMQIFGLG